MRIAFIKVNMMYSKGKDALKPLVFPIVEALTPADWEIVFYDERIETLPDDIDADIIAFSVETFAARHAYELADRYRKKWDRSYVKEPENSEENGRVNGQLHGEYEKPDFVRTPRIVMGGFHASAMPEEILEHADTVLVGDAEDTWPLYLKDVKNGCEKRRYDSDNKCPVAYVNNNAGCFAGKKYLKLGMIQASRGCRFNCDFCSIKSLYPSGVRQKDIEDVVREIRDSHERLLFFIDDNLFVNEKTVKELFEAVRPLKKRWACQISMDIAFNDELLKLMHDAGCIMVLIGFESLDERNLKIMHKSANIQVMHSGVNEKTAGRPEKDNIDDRRYKENELKYEAAINNIYKHGIMIYAMFVLGYDHDTAGSIERTYEFAMRNNLAVANFNPLMILPGTELFKRMSAEGQLRYEKWWLDPGYRYGDAMFYPRSMSCEELTEGCKRARYDFNSFRNIMKRLTGAGVNHRSLFNTVVFLLVNLISRTEIHRKQGTELGGNRTEKRYH